MAKMGRPKKDLNWDKLDTMLQYGPYLTDVVEYLNSTVENESEKVSEDTVEKRIRERFNCTFTEYRNKKMWRTRFNLVERGLQMALNGDKTMLIFYLKNFCGFCDNPVPQVKTDEPSYEEPVDPKKVA